MTLRVEPAAMRTAANQFDDHAQDAATTRKYIHQYGDLTWHSQGMLAKMRGAHDHLITNVAATSTRLNSLLDGTGSELRRAAAYYQRTDAETATEFDRTLPSVPRHNFQDSQVSADDTVLADTYLLSPEVGTAQTGLRHLRTGAHQRR